MSIILYKLNVLSYGVLLGLVALLSEVIYFSNKIERIDITTNIKKLFESVDFWFKSFVTILKSFRYDLLLFVLLGMIYYYLFYQVTYSN